MKTKLMKALAFLAVMCAVSLPLTGQASGFGDLLNAGKKLLQPPPSEYQAPPSPVDPVHAAPADLPKSELPDDLKGLFSGHVFDTSNMTTDQFPTVALTLESAPDFHQKWVDKSTSIGCSVFRATVWRTKSDKREYSNLKVCSDRVFASQYVPQDIVAWVHDFSIRKNTGNDRTYGPTPPQRPLPQDAKTSQYIRGAYEFGLTGAWDQVVLAALLDYLDFNDVEARDHRVWIVKMEPAFAS